MALSAGAGAALLLGLSGTGGEARGFARLVGAVFLGVLLISALLQAAMLATSPRAAADRRRWSAPARIDVALLLGVVVLVCGVLSMGPSPESAGAVVTPPVTLAALAIIVLSIVRFAIVLVVLSGDLIDRRRARAEGLDARWTP